MVKLQIAMPSTNIYFVPYNANHIPNDRKREQERKVPGVYGAWILLENSSSKQLHKQLNVMLETDPCNKEKRVIHRGWDGAEVRVVNMWLGKVF